MSNMRKKALFIIIVVYLTINNTLILYSQDIAVNLSIKWTESPCVYKADSIVSYPKLVMSYTNNSNNDYYFRKFTHDKNGLPTPACAELMTYGPDSIDTTWNYIDYLKSITKEKWFENHNFIVEIYLPYWYHNYWFAIPDTVAGENIDYIGCTLSHINGCLINYVSGYEEDDTNRKKFFTESDITEYAIKHTNNQFMFLKAGETQEDSYKLVCFYLLKGTYSFVIKDNRFKDNVIDNPPPFDVSSLPLPEKVDEFKLYSGEFTANSVTVTF